MVLVIEIFSSLFSKFSVGDSFVVSNFIANFFSDIVEIRIENDRDFRARTKVSTRN